MILADIEDCLGNQLFGYASTKSIALDLDYEYRYRVIRPSYTNRETDRDTFGHEWSAAFERHLNIDISERIDTLPKEVTQRWDEPWPREHNYQESVYQIGDNTVLSGHFCSPRYFQHRRREVLEWFRFENGLRHRCESLAADFRRLKHNLPLVAVHVRYGRDYLQQTKAVALGYYGKAISELSADFGPLNVLLFSDNLESVEPVLRKIDPELSVVNGTMFEDLCLMSLCDFHVIGNSSFGWWGAWLGERETGVVVRPSIFPLGNGQNYPLDIFPESWRVEPATRVEPSIVSKPMLWRRVIRGFRRRLHARE